MNEDLIIILKKGVRIIKFNRPQQRNAITSKMYKQIRDILAEDALDDKVVLTIFTGSGIFYCSGNDFKERMNSVASGDYVNTLNESLKEVELFIDTLITYPKLVIAVINGPAIGIAATTAALCDIVYATENAYFHAPFLQLGICPEGGSSYTFPMMLGRSKASEMIFLNEKLTAQEAYRLGFVAKLIPSGSVDKVIEELLAYGETLPVHCVKIAKELLSANFRNILCECNKRESIKLKELMQTEFFFNAIASGINRKSKL